MVGIVMHFSLKEKGMEKKQKKKKKKTISIIIGSQHKLLVWCARVEPFKLTVQ